MQYHLMMRQRMRPNIGRLKSTAGVTPKLADVEHVAEAKEKYANRQNMEYSVRMDENDVNDNYLSYDEAVRLYDKYKAQGYDDIQLDARIKESVNESDLKEFKKMVVTIADPMKRAEAMDDIKRFGKGTAF